MKKENKAYAYRLANGNTGVCDNWKDCEKIVSGKEARYRGFKTSAEAEEWLKSGARYESKVKGSRFNRGFSTMSEQKSKVDLIPGLYFDAGTGRGNGVEISVTDENGKNLLHKIMPKSKINKFGKHHLGKSFTNNYGELLACRYALKLAIKKGIKKVFGDSKLVIDYWSRGFIKRKELPSATIKLADKTTKLRKEFELAGGEILRISGDDNPADLGFH